MSPQKNKVNGRDLIRVAALSSDIKDTLKTIEIINHLTRKKNDKFSRTSNQAPDNIKNL
jgi:hypothetical protein